MVGGKGSGIRHWAHRTYRSHTTYTTYRSLPACLMLARLPLRPEALFLGPLLVVRGGERVERPAVVAEGRDQIRVRDVAGRGLRVRPICRPIDRPVARFQLLLPL